MIKQCMLVFALAACGGGAKSAKTPPGGATTATTDCTTVGTHVAGAVFTWKEPPPTTKENVALVIKERCEVDGWTTEAKKCFGGISDEASTEPCIKTLSEDQHKKVMDAMESKFDHKDHAKHHDDAEGGTGSRAPASAPPPTGSGSKGPAKGADPCEGGE
jgi:hypothetical protein